MSALKTENRKLKTLLSFSDRIDFADCMTGWRTAMRWHCCQLPETTRTKDTLMYEDFFRLHSRPFTPSADTNCYVGIGPIEDARQSITRAISRASGPTVVIGGAGTGKTMLCQVLAEQFHQQLAVVQLSNARLSSPRALLQAVLFELGRPYRDLDENELRLSLVDFLSNADQCPDGMLLIIDEAHTLPLRLLEEVRLMTNLVRDGQAKVRLVLAGGPALEERFTSPKLESFNQRLAARCYLDRLNREQTSAYIREQITLAGGEPQSLFGDDACRAVYAATDGIPRLVSQVCDHALILAAVGRKKSVTAQIVEEAWADLQQLPAPWVEPAVKAGALAPQEVIEFGTLTDEDDAQPATTIPFPQPAATVAWDSIPSGSAKSPGIQPNEAVVAKMHASESPTEVFTTPQADVQLDEIERSVIVATGSFADEGGYDEFDAPIEEISHDPFGDLFDEEEVIVDTYANLDDTQLANAPKVASREGREIAAILAARASVSTPGPAKPAPTTAPAPAVAAMAKPDPRTAVMSTAALSTPAATVKPVPLSVSAEVAGQRQQRELTAAVSALLDEQRAKATPATGDMAPAAQWDAESDDRDVIIVEQQDDVEQPAPTMPKGRARRQQYRQLFARLRQG
jgi:type II secretory pathway predicted ATPase ExeA